MKLLELFYKCAYSVEYQQIGDSVNYAFIEDNNTHMLQIYFQGSNSITDWVRNFFFKKKPYKDMGITWRAHAGFLAAWKEVEDTIISKVCEVKDGAPRWKKILIVGYSHGGALAAFCHECVWFWRPDLRETGLVGYGFEAPRIYASLKVRKELLERWKKFTVVRNKNDIVTHCPPKLFGYTHVGNMLHIGANTELVRHTKFKCVDAHYQDNVMSSLADDDYEIEF